MIIYKIKNRINGKVYVGLTTKDLSKRIAGHISENKSYVQKALNKYGLQSFDVSIIDSAESKDILFEKEKYWIQHFDCKVPKGYNLTDGGEGLINPSEVVRKQISKSVSKVLKGNTYRKGIPHTDKSKKAISEGLRKSEKKRKADSNRKKYPPLTEEHKKKISLSKRGKKRNDVVWNKGLRMPDYSPDYVNPMMGKKRPDLSERNRLNKGVSITFKNPLDRTRKISESRKGKKYPKKQPELYLVVNE
jgi:group I intron endonuclease